MGTDAIDLFRYDDSPMFIGNHLWNVVQSGSVAMKIELTREEIDFIFCHMMIEPERVSMKMQGPQKIAYNRMVKCGVHSEVLKKFYDLKYGEITYT